MYDNEDREVELSGVEVSSELLELLRPLVIQPQVRKVPELPGLPENVQRLSSLQNFGASIELLSDSFSVVPSGKTNFPLLAAGPKLKFVITPQKIGQRKILVRSRLNSEAVKALQKLSVSGDQDRTLDINVMPERTMFGLTSSQLQGIQFVFSAVGFPALMIALLTFIMESRKEKKEERRSQAKPRAGKAKR